LTKIDLHIEEINILSGVYGEPTPKIVLKGYPNVYSDTESNTYDVIRERTRQVLGNLNYMILNKHKRLEGLHVVLSWNDEVKKPMKIEVPDNTFRIDPKSARHVLFEVNKLKIGFEDGQTEDEMKYVVGYNDAINKVRKALHKIIFREKKNAIKR